jgi:transposase
MTTQEYYAIMRQELNEKQWRHFLALEALKIGHGGINQVMTQTGVAWQTIKKGIQEIEAGEVYQPGERIRRRGGGKKKLAEHTPDIEVLVEQTADPKGDPERAIRWTSLSMDHIATALNEQGYRISPMSVYRVLKAKGFALKANKKNIEGNGNHPDRDAQFEHINQMGLTMAQKGAVILSVDCKKTELIGNFKNNGREWVAEGMDTAVNIYDFGEKDKDGQRVKAIPYGVYDVLKKQGFVNVGIDHNTAAFAVESITRYWEGYGKHTYRDAKELLILADGGSSNGTTNKLWKVSLQKLANQTGLTVHVCHYPPGTSKWNAIEHQLFSFIAINWRAKPLLSYAVMLELLNHTKTKSGLTVTAVIDDNRYETGLKITREAMDSLNIERDLFHGDWNYTIAPQPTS